LGPGGHRDAVAGRGRGLAVAARHALQGKLIDPVGAGMVGVALQPAAQFVIGGFVPGVHQPLVFHMAHQAHVGHFGDQLVGGAPVGRVLKLEYAAVAVSFLLVELSFVDAWAGLPAGYDRTIHRPGGRRLFSSVSGVPVARYGLTGTPKRELEKDRKAQEGTAEEV
jgi:hypothetical protein